MGEVGGSALHVVLNAIADRLAIGSPRHLLQLLYKFQALIAQADDVRSLNLFGQQNIRICAQDTWRVKV
jgi:hypothetical protein